MAISALLLDDDKHIRESLGHLLPQHEIAVEAFARPDEAREGLAKKSYDVILADIILDEQQNGLHFVESLQQSGNKIPVIIISGNPEFEYAREALRLGVFDFIQKPFKTKQLIQCIRNAAKARQLELRQDALEKERKEYQKQLEDEVAEKVRQLEISQEKYRTLSEKAVNGIAIIDNEKTFYYNPSFADIFECPKESNSSFYFLEHIAQHKRRMVQVLFDACLDLRRDKCHFQVWARTCNDKPIYLDAWATRSTYEEKPVILLMCLDITDHLTARQRHKVYELELLKEHRMAAIGQLAAGIAHNMNTPISIIQGNAELLQLKYEDEPEVEMILRQVRRMNELIGILIRKGKKELNAEMEEISINSLIRHELQFFKANLFYKHNVKTELDLDGSILPFVGRYSDLSQGIMAIIQNAVEALQTVELREIYIQTRRADDDAILLKIRDSGPGMDDDVLAKIFNPFFSTKPKSQNSDEQLTHGLGLYLARNTFTKYGIEISVNSKPEQGTEFTLKIPTGKKNSNAIIS